MLFYLCGSSCLVDRMVQYSSIVQRKYTIYNINLITDIESVIAPIQLFSSNYLAWSCGNNPAKYVKCGSLVLCIGAMQW